MKRKDMLRAIGLVLLAAVLVGTGLVSVVRVYRHYRADMLNYESRHLNSIVSSSARGMDWMMDGYAFQLDRLLDRREFIRAENEYAESGDAVVMRALLARRDVLRVDMPYSVAVYAADGTLLGATDAAFPAAADGTPGAAADEALGGSAFLREDSAGEFWFVFRQRSETGLVYELAVPVQTVFENFAPNTRVGRHGVLFCTDAENRFFASSGSGTAEVRSVDALVAADPHIDRETLAQLTVRGERHPEDYAVYRYPWGAYINGAGTDETLVVTWPLTMGGGSLVIGAAMSFQEFDSFLSNTLQEVTWIILMEIGGALLLFFVAAWVLVMHRRNSLELQAVRERADLMEEINREQQSLAHTERLLQLGVMTSGIVHEFNNMLTPIMSQSLLLLESLSDESSPQFENALDIYEASESARDTLRRISAMGKKDVDLDFHSIEVGTLLRSVTNLAAMAKDPHIQQDLSLPKEPIFIEGNEKLLIQALLNLCINAFQAMGSEGSLTLSAAEELRSGHRYARIQVQDTGPGIPEKWLSSIYDPYFTTKGERGTGLGLAICQQIIETHKGTIQAENREGGGAVFTVRIPVREPEAFDE